jgi:hypothetical protein
MMRAWKAILFLVGGLAISQYLLVYYNSTQFNYFVQRQMDLPRSKDQLRAVLLNGAPDFSVSLQHSNINITTTDGVLRVGVDYRVPLNLLVYHPEVRFHTRGAGLLSTD